MDHREQVEAIKASWLEDPCWDLEDMDLENTEYAHLKPYADEITAFARDTKARWKAEREAEHIAAIDKIQGRILGRLAPEYRTPAGAMSGLIRSLAEEIQSLRVRSDDNANAAGAAHTRLDKIGAPPAET